MKDNHGFSGLFSLTAALILGFLWFPAQGWSQDFPNRPITVYCGFEAGATTDLTARALAEEGQKALGVPVVVENKAGGGSTVAASLVASKKPDGYTSRS
jgi:tripartite-type tricarboxylate transporter receptor subunit TctC